MLFPECSMGDWEANIFTSIGHRSLFLGIPANSGRGDVTLSLLIIDLLPKLVNHKHSLKRIVSFIALPPFGSLAHERLRFGAATGRGSIFLFISSINTLLLVAVILDEQFDVMFVEHENII